jgi:hypothetical protein
MNKMDIEREISAALADRAGQRDFVNDMTQDWQRLVECFGDLTAYAATTGRGAAGVQTSDAGQRAIFSGAADYLAGDASWLQKARSVQARLDACTEHVGTLHRRVHRETVNIGVIGITGAGKSTLLRRISGLHEEQIPSNEYTSTTAAPCRIFHERSYGPGSARLTLHTWDTFREAVLVPLHKNAQIGPAPQSLAEFRRFEYPQPSAGISAGQAGAERYRDRLRIAQASLPSYEGLLVGGTRDITLDQLRPYVAYPGVGDPQSQNRPYHAVQAIDVFCPFEDVGAVRLGLVDLPGSGEAGLDVHGRFLQNMRNDVDMLFIVKRPEKANVQIMDQDWDVVQLADEATGGVRRDDFFRYIINTDSTIPPNYLEQAWAAAQQTGDRLGIDVRKCDIKRSANVTEEVLAPALQHLAKRLADMDRDAVQQVLTELREVVGEVRSLIEELGRRIGRWLSGLPDEQERFRTRARELKNKVSVALGEVLKKYDDLAKAGQPIEELDQEIASAVADIHQWVSEGLGEGSADQWLQKFDEAAAGREIGRELDRQYNSARSQVSQVFGRIDESLASSVVVLWQEIADAMREKLTEHVIPAGPDSRAVLAEFEALADGRRLKRLAEATGRLLALQTEYGNIFLRVGRPVVRDISWYQGTGTGAGSAIGAAAAVGAVGAIAGLAVAGPAGHVLGGAAGHAVGSVASAAASSAARQAFQQVSNPVPKWWGSPGGQEAPTPAPAPQQQATPQPQAPPQMAPQQQGGSKAARDRYPAAARELDQLVDLIKRVTADLEREFRTEARGTVKVLAAATDLFLFSATGTPDVEVEFEKLCEPIQRVLWPDAFAQATAKVAGDLAVLQGKAAETQAAAEPIAVRASRGRLL